MSTKLKNEFKLFIKKEGIEGIDEIAITMMERAFFAGASGVYDGYIKKCRMSRIEHPTNEFKSALTVKEWLDDVRNQLSDYWKQQLMNINKNKSV